PDGTRKPDAEPGPRGAQADDIVIGSGVVSTGTFVTGGLICIDGTLCDSDERADCISISHGGKLHGKAWARHVEVFGAVSGELLVSELVVLRASAKVTGRLSSPCIVMHRGATVNADLHTVGLEPLVSAMGGKLP